MKQIDQIDKEILKILQEDCRITAKDIAAHLNMSKTPVYERIKKLESQGYIKKYVAITDPKKANKGLITYLSVLLNNHSQKDIAIFNDKIKSMKQVAECYYVSGNTDFLLKVYTRDMEDYHKFITQEFSNIENMNRFYSTFVLENSKQETAFEF